MSSATIPLLQVIFEKIRKKRAITQFCNSGYHSSFCVKKNQNSKKKIQNCKLLFKMLTIQLKHKPMHSTKSCTFLKQKTRSISKCLNFYFAPILHEMFFWPPHKLESCAVLYFCLQTRKIKNKKLFVLQIWEKSWEIVLQT